MKNNYFFSILACILFSYTAYSNGVAIKNASNNEYFQLISSEVEVTVYDQIAIVVTTQAFLNNTGENTLIKYAYPLPESASGTGLRWNLNNNWYSAVITPSPQDTTLPGGGGGSTNLNDYLGETPLYFDLLDTIPNDSILIVELTYVSLLPYNFYEVEFLCPNDYSLLQNTILDYQMINFVLESQRTVTNIEMLSHTPNTLFYTDSTAGFSLEIYEEPATEDYLAVYELSPDDMGLFSYSTFITDTNFNCDTLGNGFFTFIVEPDPSSQVIDKVFTLIIDRSGSMSGDKIVQARDAASYIISNLNEGDQFNIVDFSTEVTSLYEDHVAFDPSSQATALSYIEGIYASGSTNIAGSFSEAIPDFAASDTNQANIIVFFTDGMANVGVSTTEGILEHIEDLIIYHDVMNLSIHSFGIGSNVNQQLLSQIASENNGLCQFLGDDELEGVITTFYNMIRNPVLMNTQISVDPPILTQVYPDPLGNLYLGQQLIVVGRYSAASPVTVTFTGNAFGQPQTYEYDVDLADTNNTTYQFLTKLWAKEKMYNLYVLFHTYDPESPEAIAIKEEIIGISICYNVISPFTSYSGGGGGPVGIEYDETELLPPEEVKTYAYPNPFNNGTEIKFIVDDQIDDYASIRIYNSMGRLILEVKVEISGPGTYTYNWDGSSLPPGHYFYSIHYGNEILKGKMIKH